VEGLELICFKIITAVGNARSLYIEAIQLAKEGKYDEAKKLIKNGDESFIDGHHAHAQLIQDEATGNTLNITLLLLHAEDQLMSAESFKIIAEEFVDVYKKIG